MWVFFIAFTVLTAYFTWQLPSEWLSKKHPDRLFLIIINALGFSSLIILITIFYKIPNGPFRRVVLYTSSAYFSLLAFTAAICLFRQVSYYPLHHMARKKGTVNRLAALFENRRIFMYLVFACTALYCGAGFRNMERLSVTHYEIVIDGHCTDETIRAALISDIHVGAGASFAQLDRMVSTVNDMDADIVILAGDIADSSSSAEDLAYMFAAFSKMKSTYGTYYAEGNHEIQCRYNFLPGLEKAGVHILHDSAQRLPNGLTILGRCDDRRTPVPEILSADGIPSSSPCIVIQHRPQGLKKAAGSADLFLCGHTHGYQFPMYAFFFPVLYNCIEGHSDFGTSQVITTTGAAAWGYHCAWPSEREIAMIDISFHGGAGNEA